MDKYTVNILIIRRLQVIIDRINYIFIDIQNLIILRIIRRNSRQTLCRGSLDLGLYRLL